MPTLKAIHICNSLKPTHHQKLQKSMSLPTLKNKLNGKGQWVTMAKKNCSIELNRMILKFNFITFKHRKISVSNPHLFLA